MPRPGECCELARPGRWRVGVPNRKPRPTGVSDEGWASVAPCLALVREDAPRRARDPQGVFDAPLASERVKRRFIRSCRSPNASDHPVAAADPAVPSCATIPLPSSFRRKGRPAMRRVMLWGRDGTATRLPARRSRDRRSRPGASRPAPAVARPRRRAASKDSKTVRNIEPVFVRTAVSRQASASSRRSRGRTTDRA